MKETVPTMQQQVAPIWVKTEQTPDIPGYEVQKLLGQGGMGQVYQARHLSLQRMVAIKLVTASHNELAVARFEQEVQAIARLRHPNIAQIYDNGLINGRPYYSMEFISGGTLSARLKTSPLKPEVAARLVVKLARAMQHAHDQGILHRDLKPSNVLLEAQSGGDVLEPKIADFGLAKKLDTDSSLTQTGDVFGSPSYMAPEQASGIGKLTPAVDVYALGAVLYECMTGRPPFLGPDPMLTIMMVLSNDPVSPRTVLPKLPLDLNTICMKCLEKQPRKRYGNAGELADDLERYLKGEPIVARPVGRLERLIKWAKRRPWQATAVGLAAALLIGTIVGLGLLVYAYQQVLKANDISDKSFVISRDAVGDLLELQAGRLSLMPNMGQHTLESYQRVVKLFAELHAIRPDDRETALAYQQHVENYVQQLVANSKADDALKFAQTNEQLIKQERQKRPEDIDWRMAELRHAIAMGWLYRQRLEPIRAITYDTQAMERLNGLKREQPDNLKLLKYSIDLINNGISDDIAKLTSLPASPEKQALMDKVVDQYREIVQNRERIYQIEASQEHASLLVSSRRSLATILIVTRRTDEAEKLYDSIMKMLPLLKMPDREAAHFLVKANVDRSELARVRKDWPTARKLLEGAEQANQKLRGTYPDDPMYLHNEHELRFKFAILLHDEGKQAEAISQIEDCIKNISLAFEKNPQNFPLVDLRTGMQQQLAAYRRESNPPQKAGGK
jgi:hypothetical protein